MPLPILFISIAAIKAVLDTAILSEDGNLTEESAALLEEKILG